MKIGIINDHFSSGPGGQHRIQNLSIGLDRLGHEVTYISPQGASDKMSILFVERGSRQMSSSSLIKDYFNDFFKIFRNLQTIRDNPDFVIVELPNTMLKAVNGLFINDANVAFDFAGLWTSTFDKSKTFQRSGNAFSSFRFFSQLFEDSLSLITSRLPDVITVPTTPMKKFLEHTIGRKTHLIYHPVDLYGCFNPNLLNPKISAKLIPERFRGKTLILLGVKGDKWFFDDFCRLINKVKLLNVAFVILGSFPAAQNLVSKNGFDKFVYFAGNVPYEMIPYYASTCSFAVVLTPPQINQIWYSPHNISKIAEFLALGKPVITDTLGAVDYVLENETGFFVKSHDDLVDRVNVLVKDPDLLLMMSSRARKFAVERLDCEQVAQKYIQLIN